MVDWSVVSFRRPSNKLPSPLPKNRFPNKKGVPVSNAESSSLPVPIGPRRPLRVEALPAERHPAAVYPASLGSGSRR